MEPLIPDLLVLLLAVFAVLLGYGLAASWRRALREAQPLPFFELLRGEGLSPGEAQEAAGLAALAQAARRCAYCVASGDCARRLATATCPNAGLVAQIRRPRA